MPWLGNDCCCAGFGMGILGLLIFLSVITYLILQDTNAPIYVSPVLSYGKSPS